MNATRKRQRSRHSIADIPLDDLSRAEMINRRGFHEHLMEIELGAVFISALLAVCVLPTLRLHPVMPYVLGALVVVFVLSLVFYIIGSRRINALDAADTRQSSDFFKSLHDAFLEEQEEQPVAVKHMSPLETRVREEIATAILELDVEGLLADSDIETVRLTLDTAAKIARGK